MPDWTFAYWNCCFADSPAPEIVLKHDGWEWKPCASLMRKAAPQIPSTETVASIWRQWDRPATERAHVAVPWKPLLDLIYTGHAVEAWKLLDAAWPGDMQGKAAFRRDFLTQLRRSPAWQALLEMNGPVLDS
jgi:hypothetical protein